MKSEQVKNLRELLGLSQRKFGELVGVASSTVAWWETGRSNVKGPKLAMLERLRDKGIEGLEDFKPEPQESPRIKIQPKSADELMAGSSKTQDPISPAKFKSWNTA